MSKKRTKKYNPNRSIQANSHLNNDYIVYAVDSIAMGVLDKTGKHVLVNEMQYQVLQRSIHERLCFAGALYKDAQGETQIEYTVFQVSRCTGQEAMVEINKFANDYCDEIGLANILGKFYFVTGDLSWKLDDVFLYNVLKNAGAFDLLMTQKEYVIAEHKDREEYMDKFNPKTTQVGGDHYSRLAIQPIEIIKGLRLSWNLANAYKYVSRYAYKNKHQDLAKAYDYIARELHDGYQMCYNSPATIDRTKTTQYISQFDPKQGGILRAIEDVHRKRWVKSNEGKAEEWKTLLIAIMFDINQLCKEKYGVRAY